MKPTPSLYGTSYRWALLLPGGPQPVAITGRDKEGNVLVGYKPINVNVVFGEIEPILITMYSAKC